MSDDQNSFGRIEVAPGVLTMIAHLTTLKVAGVNKMASPPTEMSRFFRRDVNRQDGIVLDMSDGELAFDVYVFMDPNVNVMETSRRLQAAIVESIDKMVGVPVKAVNIHVEDVVYSQEEAA